MFTKMVEAVRRFLDYMNQTLSLAYETNPTGMYATTVFM